MAPREQTAAQATMESYFHDVVALLDGLIEAKEVYTATFSAETSDFVRMNRGKVRQPGSVAQRYLDIDLIRGARHATYLVALSGDVHADRTAIASAVAATRTALSDVADDPHLLLATEVCSTREVRGGALPPAETIIDTVLDAARGTDLVGLYAGGPVCRGFANSFGQRNWHEATAFNLQWSLYHRADKAVKCALSGFGWDAGALATKMEAARADLVHMTRPSKALPPGKYRAYLSPAAMEDIASMMCWGGFSARALATKQSSLTRMQPGEDPAGNGEGIRLHPSVTIVEATAEGVAPAFQGEGFVRPARVPLIEAGRLTGSLVSPRTEREFGLKANGANGWEAPESLAMAGGTLAANDALAALGTGLFVGNLHYLNYSDRPACRLTGMTRFATFWVEGGKIVAPIDVLRFDDTVFRMLGPNLADLTSETELMLASDTYGARQLSSIRVPGALISEMTFTL